MTELAKAHGFQRNECIARKEVPPMPPNALEQRGKWAWRAKVERCPCGVMHEANIAQWEKRKKKKKTQHTLATDRQ